MNKHPSIPSATLIFMLALGGCSDNDGSSETQNKASEEPLSEGLMQGKQTVETTCIACHGQGLNGAPILGNKKMWAKRLPQGEDTLVDHAINGFAYEMMPPRGGNPDLSDQDIRHAVQYMMSLVSD